MNRKPSGFMVLAVSLVCVLVLAACNCAPTLRYVVITPASATAAVGSTQQFTATGYYSNGSITPGISASWGSSSSSVATISSSGVATAVAAGTTSITATALGITATPATLTVNEQLTSIAISPLNQTIAVGATEQYKATGTFAGTPPTTMDITSQVTWNVGTATVASFSATAAGLATGLAAGTTTISASLDDITSNVTDLTVGSNEALVITPSDDKIAVGNSVSFTAVVMNGGTPSAPTYPVTWSSSSTGVANVVTNGNAAALGAGFSPGTTTITATENSPIPLVATATLTVDAGTAKYAFVSNVTDLTIGPYTVTATASPYLKANGTPMSFSTVLPEQTVLHPGGKFMYVIGQLSYANIFTITNGIPAYTDVSILGGSTNWNFGVVDPFGRFLYESDAGNGSGTYPNGTIYGFTISQTDGNLTVVPGSPITANLSSGRCLVIDHSGQYLYATNHGNNTVSAYKIDQSTGALAPLITGATTPTGKGPQLATLDPSGTHLYVANGTDGSISSYSIGAGGVLTSLGTDTVVTGALSVFNVAVSPDGNYLYVVDTGNPTATPAVHGQVYGFLLDAGSPSTPISGTPIATGLAGTASAVDSAGIAIDPTGSLLAVDNGGSSNISLFTIGSGGALTSDTPVATGNGPLFVTFYNVP
jgi:Bacterial Ig-like domain (group 2)/Lactonase, 7-bladed beta-propeller